MGSVKVELAKGLDVKVETFTSLGTARSSYPDHPHARATLRLEAQLGSVRVREKGEAEDPRHGDWPDWRRWWSGAASAFERPPASAPSASARPESFDAPPAGDRDTSVRLILEMVQAGKLSAVEAERLIRAMGP